MATVLSRAIGVVAILLGIAWVIRPMGMVRLQYRVLYFWADQPDLSHINPSLARASGVFLAILGAILLAGIMP